MPLMRRCSVRWYSSSSRRYCSVSVSTNCEASRSIEVHRIETLDVSNMLAHHELQFIGQLPSGCTASSRPGDERHCGILHGRRRREVGLHLLTKASACANVA